MSVKVAAGTVYVENSSWTQNSLEPRFYVVTRDAEEEVNISSNPSGSTRIDLVCQEIDKVTTPNDEADNVCPITVVEGTPGAGAPATPNDHELLAVVEVEDGATSITNSEITDSRRQAMVGGPMTGGGWIPAGETWTYASADDPTFTFTIPGDLTGKYSAGMRIKLTQTTAKYFIVTAVSYSDPNTTVTVYGGTDYDLANAAITSPYYSTQKAPHGFPLSPAKWSVIVTDTSANSQNTPTQNTWYNLGGSINIPIGVWSVDYQTSLYISSTSATTSGLAQTTLSTANDSESDINWSTYSGITGASSTMITRETFTRAGVITLATKDTYYLNYRTASPSVATIQSLGNVSPSIIRAVCVYL